MKNESWCYKIQPDGSDKKEVRKRGLVLKYNYSSGKIKQKIQVYFTKMQFNGPDKKDSRKSGCH